MRVLRLRRLLALGLGLFAGVSAVWALPNPDKPIDPTKRAPVSTANAVKPGARPVSGKGVVGGRVIPMSQIPLQPATAGGRRAAIDVRETREKGNVLKPTGKAKTMRAVEIQRAADRPAAIPRIAADQFQRMLREYEKDRVPAAEMMAGEIRVGDRRISLAEINRFANPRATLEAQGIPVTSAGSGEASPAASNETVPIAQEKNGGAPSNPPAADKR